MMAKWEFFCFNKIGPAVIPKRSEGSPTYSLWRFLPAVGMTDPKMFHRQICFIKVPILLILKLM